MKRLYVGGTFDLLHSGHIALFKRCKELGTVIVALNRDEFVTRYKRKPIMPFNERKAVLEACKYIDEVVVNVGDEDSKLSIFEAKPTHIVHGDDWTGEALMKQMMLSDEFLKEQGIEMLYLPYTEGISTSGIIKATKAIIICHHLDNVQFLEDLQKSISSKYPVVVCTAGIERPENSYEVGAIQYGKDNFEHFILLQDTCLIKDTALLEEVLEMDGHVAFTDRFFHYMGKYESSKLPEIPVVNSKREAITLESSWGETIGEYNKYQHHIPIISDVFEDRHGRLRMKLESELLIKYKTTFE